MTAGCVRRTLLALLLSGICTTASAGGLERYCVTLALQPGDDIRVITSQMAGTYRLRVQPEDATQPSTMIVVASESSVEMLRRDRRVAGVERVAESNASAARRPGDVTPTAIPGFGAFSYDGAGNITAIGEDTFIYNNLGRQKKATLGTNTEEYTYDRYGNIQTVKTGGVTKTLGVQASSNRMNQNTADLYATYDARGNVTQTSAGATFAYDGTDVVKASMFDGANHLYLYTAGDERIGTITSISGTIVRSDWTVRDPSGKVLRRFAQASDGTWSWEEDYIYRDGQLLAAEVPRPEKTLHFHLDHLGTPRVITGNGGAQVAQHTYYPFGTELTDPAQDSEVMKFTGHERDAASLDYMHARYYNAVMGRFLSVDPGRDWSTKQPQSWNRYAYARNNPIKYTDPTGRYVAICPPLSLACLGQVVAFEKARTANLNSNRPAIAGTSRAYGAPNQNNGVFVTFANTGKSDGLTRTPISANATNTGFQMSAFVTINSGISGPRLNAAVAHEGQHVSDAQAFFATVRYDAGTNELNFDTAKSLTAYQTEMNAYRITAAVAIWKGVTIGLGPYSFGPGMSPKQIDAVANQLLADPRMGYGLSPTNQGSTQTGW